MRKPNRVSKGESRTKISGDDMFNFDVFLGYFLNAPIVVMGKQRSCRIDAPYSVVHQFLKLIRLERLAAWRRDPVTFAWLTIREI
jgi:hypothetical protein